MISVEAPSFNAWIELVGHRDDFSSAPSEQSGEPSQTDDIFMYILSFGHLKRYFVHEDD